MTSRQDPPRRRTTRDQLFDLIRERGQVTRPGLAELTGIPRSTVNQSLEQLFREGRIVEVDDVRAPGSGRGRPATAVRAVATGAAVAGVDFGHHHVNVALGDAFGQPVAVESVTLDVDLQADQALDVASGMLERLRREHDVEDLAAVVAGIPGPLGLADGRVCSPTILSGWVGRAPAAELQARVGIPVHAENDALLGAYGELLQGAGRGYDDFLYVKASHGIGAGVVIGGQPYRGGTGLAGEIGHTLLPGHSELCRCGNRGCLEAVVSVPSVRAQIAHTRPGVDPDTVGLSGLDGDPIAARILHTAGRTLGEALADLVNLLNPTAIVIGGELGSADGPLVEGVQAAIRLHAQPATADALVVLPAALGTRAELTGALHLAAVTAAR
ncbi:ROK family protein [Jatrophihabitans sp. YIM 134969]